MLLSEGDNTPAEGTSGSRPLGMALLLAELASWLLPPAAVAAFAKW